MPRAGYKTITLREEDYAHFIEEYSKHKNELRKQGITSFAGFVTKKLHEAVDTR